jgi:hypothetical protein
MMGGGPMMDGGMQGTPKAAHKAKKHQHSGKTDGGPHDAMMDGGSMMEHGGMMDHGAMTDGGIHE